MHKLKESWENRKKRRFSRKGTTEKEINNMKRTRITAAVLSAALFLSALLSGCGADALNEDLRKDKTGSSAV